MVYVANLRGCSNSSDATPERSATAVAGIQEIASVFGAAVQLKGSSRMLRNTFVQYLIMVAELLRVLKYIRNRSNARSKNVKRLYALDGVRRRRNGCRENYGSRLQAWSAARGSLTVVNRLASTKVGVKSSENCATGRTKLSAERPYFTALLH
jgi:hypothetical protein